MPALPLPPVIGSTENALRSLLRKVLSNTVIRGYDEWVYLSVRSATDGGATVEELVAGALKQPAPVALAIRSRLVDSGLLDAAGALTALGRDQLNHGRELVSSMTQTLTADIDTAQLQTTIETLDTVRRRVLRHWRGSGASGRMLGWSSPSINQSYKVRPRRVITAATLRARI